MKIFLKSVLINTTEKAWRLITPSCMYVCVCFFFFHSKWNLKYFLAEVIHFFGFIADNLRENICQLFCYEEILFMPFWLNYNVWLRELKISFELSENYLKIHNYQSFKRFLRMVFIEAHTYLITITLNNFCSLLFSDVSNIHLI